MFDPVDPKQNLPDMEEGILQYWKEEDIFKRSVHEREGSEDFSFYDGPPFATGLPHYGHLLAGTIKDVIPRYQTMKGKKVERRFGWDCHGLPVENLIEKEHGIKSHKEIEEIGVEKFNALCCDSVQRYTQEWRSIVERMGRWVDMDWDYRTMDPEFMESIWWAFKQLHEKDLVYEGKKSMHVCPRCVTPLSNFEVTLGYKDVVDYSITLKFKSDKEPKTYFLAWTTTPWCLPGQIGLTVHPKVKYQKVKVGDEFFWCAKNRVEEMITDEDKEVVEEVKGKELEGQGYIPLFPYNADKKDEYEWAFKILVDEYVADEDGTGFVTTSPDFGEDDMRVCRKYDIPFTETVEMNGTFREKVTDFAGLNVKPEGDRRSTEKLIVKKLQEEGKVLSCSDASHSYPHCWRCDSPLMNYSTSSWFVAVEKIKDDLLKANSKTNWVPDHVRDGRFGKWLEGARDWAISRNRFWGTPIPIWRCEETGEIEVIGSRDDLMKHAPDRFSKLTAIRHGESEGNLVPMYQGVLPGTDLTDNGKKQIKELSKNFKDEEIKVIYCSPFARTKQTAHILAKESGAEVIEDDRLREIDFGEYEGKTIDFSDLEFVKARRAKKLKTNAPESIFHFSGMETWEQAQERIDDFLKEVLPKHKSEHVLVITHADLIRNITHFMNKTDPMKLSHQPYPQVASPHTFFWDHQNNSQMDLHKHNTDDIEWDGYKRIPEVFDCWFESGSMPYAQPHFPFENGGKIPSGFPADFIAEGMDQTRGWFYTLMILSTALFDEPAFHNCVVNGIVLAEDGKKMSKSLNNYPDPMLLTEKYGADAVRFTLMSSPAVRGEDLRFSEKMVAESMRNVLLKLWNSYSFFVTYANAAKFDPTGTRKDSKHPLDVWIKAEVQDLANRMTEQLDKYELSFACSELDETIDALTNWYIRLSRRRFAGKGEDQLAALETMYEVLLTLSQMIAPFCPYLSDAIYLNLVPEEHGSVHLTDWPVARKLKAQEKELLERTRVMRLIVSLGHKARSEKNIKVRQPLRKAKIALPPSMTELSEENLSLLRQELNVKELAFADDPKKLADVIVRVDARKVGPRLGKRVQEVIQAGKNGDYTINDDGTVLILEEKLTPDEAEIVYMGKEGLNAAADKGVVVSVDTEVSDDLKSEGQARDLIRTIQRLRKEAGLTFTDQIDLKVEGADDILKTHGDLIAEETRSAFKDNKGKGEVVNIDNRKITVNFVKSE